MSYNDNPEWTKDVELPKPEDMVCPECNKASTMARDIMLEMLEGGYYAPRHIPPVFIFTCDNSDCLSCDEDYEYRLSLVVTATPVVKQ